VWYSRWVLKHPKRPRDLSQLAAQIGRQATGQEPKPPPYEPSVMAERGRKGGLKGGKARAKKLTRAQRTRIARTAARARWGT
jgi:hypothetical protein